MNKIILALDVNTCEEALNIVLKTKEYVWGYKLGSILLEEGGITLLRKISSENKTMVDLKFFDIPSVMNKSIDRMIDNGASIITVHVKSNFVPAKNQRDKIAGVTILSSEKNTKTTKQDVYNLASKAMNHKYKYIVCSPMELRSVRNHNVLKICPGIRMKDDNNGDQKRTSTPSEAIENGADLIVMWRSLLNSDNIVKALKKVNGEINASI